MSSRMPCTLRLCNFTEKLIKREVIKVSAHTLETVGAFLPGNTRLRYTTTAHFIIIAFRFRRVLFTAANATKQMLSINSEVKKEHGLFSWRNTAAGCFSYAGKGKTVSHTLLKITVGVQGKLIGFRTLLDLIHGSDAGHHYSNAVRVCINENWWIPFLQTQKKGCVHEAASKDLPSWWEMKSMLAGCSISHHFNMFPSNSKQIWRVNKFTSAFLQSQNFKVKQSQK